MEFPVSRSRAARRYDEFQAIHVDLLRSCNFLAGTYHRAQNKVKRGLKSGVLRLRKPARRLE